MRAMFGLLLLAGCAAPACKQVKITETVVETKNVDHYIFVHDKPSHSVLLNDYAQTLDAEKPIVVHSKAPTINCLITLDAAARSAFEPLSAPHHKATPPEMKRAIDALGALRAGVKLQACPKK
jgi:hypothetical protein